MSKWVIAAVIFAGVGGLSYLVHKVLQWGRRLEQAEEMERKIERLEDEKAKLQKQRGIANRPARPIDAVLKRMLDDKL